MTIPIVPTPTQHENDALAEQQFSGTLPPSPWCHAMDGSAIDPQSLDPTPKTTSWPEGDSGGGGAYVAKAVHFDGSTYLQRAGLLVADDPLISASIWFNSSMAPSGSSSVALFDFDPVGIEAPVLQLTNPVGSGVTLEVGIHNGGGYSYWDSDDSIAVLDGTWHNIVVGVDGGAMAVTMKLDGISIPGSWVQNHGAGSNTFNICTVPDTSADYPPLIGDVADVWIAPGVLITDATIFRDPVTGKPKAPNTFPTSAVLFSGDATTFITNQGTGGAFTLTGALTNAASSPSDG